MAWFKCVESSVNGYNINNIITLKMSEWEQLSNINPNTLYNVTNETGYIVYKRYIGDKQLVHYISDSDLNNYEFWYEDVYIPDGITGANDYINTKIQLNSSSNNERDFEINFNVTPSMLSSTTAKAYIMDYSSSSYELKINTGSYANSINFAGQFSSTGGLDSVSYTYGTDYTIKRISNTIYRYNNGVLVDSFQKPVVTNTGEMVIGARNNNTEPIYGLINYIGFKWLS